MKKEIIKILSKETRLRPEQVEKLLETPPSDELGDFAFPCFILTKKEKKAPNEIAEMLAERLKIKNIEKIKASGPYLNFFINKEKLASQIIKLNANFGKTNIGKKKKILIDFSGPNIGKPMHIGHIRSTIIGDSLIRTYDFLGYTPIGVNYLGDVGLHLGKLIVAYELWLDKDKLKKDPVAELLRLYVKFCGKEKTEMKEGMEETPEEFQNNPWTQKAQEKLQLLELGDKKTEKIWKDIRKSSGKGFDKVYEMLNINFTETTGQSEFTKRGKELVIDAIEKKLAKAEPSGAVYVGDEKNKKYILKSNKTASYITYDLGAAVERFKKHNFIEMIYVTDYRQADHFKHLFNILNLFKYPWANKLIHLPFGTVKFGDEIMATRKGQVILLKDVLQKTIDKAKQEIKKRKTKGDAEKVGTGAIKYAILNHEPARDIQFSWKQALKFEGNTGPYLQYSYARASSIIKKANSREDTSKKPSGVLDKPATKIPTLTQQEISLIKTISKFPEIVEKAGKQMNPALIANYSFDLAKIFSEFYAQCKVIGDENEAFRLRLIDAFRTTLKNSLHLLGIEVMSEM
jgi:arginyl-tRNA synthetase